jgi:hypothetical protein
MPLAGNYLVRRTSKQADRRCQHDYPGYMSPTPPGAECLANGPVPTGTLASYIYPPHRLLGAGDVKSEALESVGAKDLPRDRLFGPRPTLGGPAGRGHAEAAVAIEDEH